MPSRKRVLFVDDEPSIRLTLPPVLEEHGFEVRSASSVAEALVEINSQQFDALLSDLNIGEEGDGFLVVSAMRHIQPRCITVILTGYPAFDTALQAIRQQVDDYLVKPADVGTLISCLREKFEKGNGRASERKRMAALLCENSPAIIRRVLEAINRNNEGPTLRLDDQARLGKLPQILQSVIAELESGSDQPSPDRLIPASQHGIQRRQQGYFASAIVTDFESLATQMYETIESNLMALGENNLVSDLKRMQQALNTLMKRAVAAHEEERDSRMRA
jgi:ActR/RegA family two-component response regulator